MNLIAFTHQFLLDSISTMLLRGKGFNIEILSLADLVITYSEILLIKSLCNFFPSSVVVISLQLLLAKLINLTAL